MKFGLFAFIAGLSVSSAAEQFVYGLDCKPCADTTGDCTVKVSVNFFASQTGYYQIEDCEGVNPTLHLTVDRTYIFDQSDLTNWYHLIGFAYEADGAHVPVDELEPGIAPGDSTCAATLSCPAPMYWQAGVYQGVYSNNPDLVPIPETPSEDFGLDVAEPLFFHPISDWTEYGPFSTSLNFNTAFDQDIFYFCHVHAGMSARIKLLDADGNMLNAENTPAIPYEYDDVAEFDRKCGTFNITDWQLPNDQCPENFVCGMEDSVFKDCVDAMNCNMMASMTSMAEGVSPLFCHQMIPHHMNAINMAKSLMKHSDLVCENAQVEEGDVVTIGCELLPLLVDIINVQNSQIIEMEGALEQLEVPLYSDCKVDFDTLGQVPPQEKTRTRGRMMEESAESAFTSGIACKPCADTSGECAVIVKVDLFAGELGYFEVDGCEGVNPTLHLTVGRTYKFDQSDISNWYHLIGFAYEADGAHVGVDELEPGIAPGDSDCADNLSCPSPLYFMNGVYQGEYSNSADVSPIPDTPSDDFGLDVVEPLFFHPIGDWESYGPMATYLNFDIEYDQDIFYFCHVHSGMSARIKLLDAAGNMLNNENVPEIPYDYDFVSAYDSGCGTTGLEKFQLPNSQCPETFVCDKEDLSTITEEGGGPGVLSLKSFADCVDSADCLMLDGMTTNFGGDFRNGGTADIVLFLWQMIPHHQNAVNMAKSLLKSGKVNCGSLQTEEGSAVSTACILEPIARSIVNTQNSQIQTMVGLLERVGADITNDCDVKEISGACDSSFMLSLVAVGLGLAALMA